MNKENNKFLLSKKILFIGLIFALPLLVSAKKLIIKDSNNNIISKSNCEFTMFSVDNTQGIIILSSISNCTGSVSIVEEPTIEVEQPVVVSTGEVIDPGTLGDNVTYGPLEGNPDGYKVYIADQGALSTAAPSCLNGKYILTDCRSGSIWNRSAKTTDVYAIRMKRSDKEIDEGIGISVLSFGAGITGSLYDYVLSRTPGNVRKSEFEGGGCEARDVAIRNMSILTKSQFDKSEYLRNSGCLIPKSTLYYVNIRSKNLECNKVGARCNSYFEKH